MSNPTIIKKLYRVTKDQPTFSLNDMRAHGIHNDFRHGNQIGSFFQWMGRVGYTRTVGRTRVKHKPGNRRWIFTWAWTDKAHQEFGGIRPNGQQRLF